MQQNQLRMIISGGQTGIDHMGLEVARQVGISTGGLAPKGYRTEWGSDESLRDFGLAEHSSADYEDRTRANVIHASGTVLFGNVAIGGTKLTLDVCIHEGKPYIVNPTVKELQQWLIDNQITILNVAGSRESQLSTEQLNSYRAVLREALQK